MRLRRRTGGRQVSRGENRDCPQRSFVAFGYTQDATREIGEFFKRTGKSIVALTVRDILDEQIAARQA